jgi:hypothetical protein
MVDIIFITGSNPYNYYYTLPAEPFVTVISSELPFVIPQIYISGGFDGDILSYTVGTPAPNCPTLFYSDGSTIWPSYECPGGDPNFKYISFSGGGVPGGTLRLINSIGWEGYGSYVNPLPILGVVLNPQDSQAYSIDPPVLGTGPYYVYANPYVNTDTYVWQVRSPGAQPSLGCGWQGLSITGAAQTIVPEVFYPGVSWLSQYNGEQIVRINDAVEGPLDSVIEYLTIPSSANGTTTTLTIELTAKVFYSDGTGSDLLGDSCYGSFVCTFTNISDVVTLLGSVQNPIPIANCSSTSMSDMTLIVTPSGFDTVAIEVTAGASIGSSSEIALQIKITAEIC